MKKFLNIPLILGVLLLAAAGIVYSKGVSFRETSTLTTGTVTGMSESTNSEDITSYCPQITFTTQTGQNIIYYPNVCSTSPQYENGDQVQLYYDPENPEEVQTRGFWTQFGIVTLLGGIGLPMIVIGVILGLPSRRKSK